MISIAITQRVVSEKQYQERRDALDQRWTQVLLAHGFWPVLVPNNERFAKAIFDYHPVGGLLLTGGDSLVANGGTAPERDSVEVQLLKNAIAHKIPVVGVCRGMQVIQQFFGVPLVPVDGHVRIRHQLKVNPASRYCRLLCELDTVSAYHGFGAFDSVPDLLISASSTDGVVMAIEHPELSIFGQMWHSEREEPVIAGELAIIKKAFQL